MVLVRTQHNHLLNAFTGAEKDRLFPHLEWVPLELGDVLYDTNEKQNHVYFPTDAIVSLLYVTEDGSSAEISMVGNEGMIGIALLTGDGTMPNRAVVQNPGHAFRIKGNLMRREFARKERLHDMLLRYAQTLFAQTAQTAVCNRFHTVDQQLCRWLLLSMDRLESDEITMTQELIANMLGVRREGVTEAAGRLQKATVIKYRRGHIKVLDRLRLEKNCCECYEAVKRESERMLDFPLPLSGRVVPISVQVSAR
ncbi:MAG: Crp/Fnr family transcriptional regulator [Xanthomonadaceae bacterium]|nr:Crp/Fnr family transcriptional regulator [Xanthomonadaceae bacterium]